MPFVQLSNTHRCPLPVAREDGALLRIGDVWECDQPVVDGKNPKAVCGKRWKWSTDQRDGDYWAPC